MPSTCDFACGICLFDILTYSRLFVIHQLEWTPLISVCFSYLSLNEYNGFVHPSFSPKTTNATFSWESSLKPLVRCWGSRITPPFQKAIAFCLFFSFVGTQNVCLGNAASCKAHFCQLAISFLFFSTFHSSPQSQWTSRAHRAHPEGAAYIPAWKSIARVNKTIFSIYTSVVTTG